MLLVFLVFLVFLVLLVFLVFLVFLVPPLPAHQSAKAVHAALAESIQASDCILQYAYKTRSANSTQFVRK